MDPSDESLLRQYVDQHSHPAFRELVRRHLDLVHSVAWRHLRSDALAAEVCQSVFLDLAQSAATLRPGQPVVAWLHLVARRTAIDVVRQEQRRRAREHEAATLGAADPSVPWTRLEPALDEALESLDAADRQALLLRYFENRSLRDVGAALGTSDDAAQKRVSRALDRLREALARRGLAAATAAGLAVELAGATTPAPAGLAGVLAGTGLRLSLATGQTATLSALNKTLIATTLVLAAGLVWQTQSIAAGRRAQEARADELATLLAPHGAARRERDAATTALAAARQRLEAAGARAAERDATEIALADWLERVAQLRQWLERTPGQHIPEMAYLRARDWLLVTRDNPLQSDMQFRRALGDLRQIAKFKPEISANFSAALSAWSRAHPGERPASSLELQPYLNPALGADLLARYEFTSSTWWGAKEGVWVLQEKASGLDEFDNQLSYGLNGGSSNRGAVGALSTAMVAAWRAFAAAHPNQSPTGPEQLQPYLPATIDPATLRDFWTAQHLPSPQ